MGGRFNRNGYMYTYGITDSMDLSSTLGVGDGQGGLACCSPWGSKGSDTTE